MLDRILRRARFLELLLGPVDLRIADVVADEPVGVDREEDWALPAARVLERAPRRLVHRLHILAVDLDGLHSERDRALRDVLDRHVLPARRRLRPVVVLADEHGRNLPELRKIERLVERPDVGGTVAEEGDADAWFTAKPEGERGSDDRRKPSADDGIRAHVSAFDVIEVHRAAVPV